MSIYLSVQLAVEPDKQLRTYRSKGQNQNLQITPVLTQIHLCVDSEPRPPAGSGSDYSYIGVPLVYPGYILPGNGVAPQLPFSSFTSRNRCHQARLPHNGDTVWRLPGSIQSQSYRSLPSVPPQTGIALCESLTIIRQAIVAPYCHGGSD